MSRSVVARVAMSRSASLSNMCSMISYRNGPAQAKRPAGLGYLLCWNGRLRWWLRIYLGGWLGTSDACGRSPWHRGSGRPAAALPAGSALARLTGRELATGNPYRIPSRTRPASPARSDKGHTRRGHPPPVQQPHRRNARHPSPTNQARPELERNPGTQPVTRPTLVAASVAQAGTAPTRRSRTNPAAKQTELEPDAGAQPATPVPLVAASSPPAGNRTDPPIPDQPGRQTGRAGT